MKRRSSVKSSKTYVVDTSVLLAYIVENATGREKVVELVEKARRRELYLYTTYHVLSELLYASSRIYEMLGYKDPNQLALNLVQWVLGFTNIAELNTDIAIRAGELKKNLRLALTDCYVIATAEYINAKALFLKVEKGMRDKLELLRRLPVEFIVG